MAKNARFCVPFRRKREGKTDYKTRKALVLSKKPLLTARTTLKNIIVQVIVAKPYGDRVLVSAHSSELRKKYNWKAPRKNLSAAYLTGLLCGLKAKSLGIDEAIFDIGLKTPSKGAKVFAVLTGVLDADIYIPHSEQILPTKERIEGEHIATYAKSLSSEEYSQKFSRYLNQNLPPETLSTHFSQVKSNIMTAFSDGGTEK